MHHRSVSAVFQVASTSGATQSLPSAEISLKNMRLMIHAILPPSWRNVPCKMLMIISIHVNFRRCHIPIMIDNLVRLKFRIDPDPGHWNQSKYVHYPSPFKGCLKHPKKYWAGITKQYVTELQPAYVRSLQSSRRRLKWSSQAPQMRLIISSASTNCSRGVTYHCGKV